MKQLVKPNTGITDEAGWCHRMARAVFNAPWVAGLASATAAADVTKYRHNTRQMPDVAVPVWFWHYGTYNGVTGEYGHVVIWVPGRGFLTSPWYLAEGQEWYQTIEEIERIFLSKYRFWSEDINGLRVAQPKPKKSAAKDIEMRTIYNTQDKNEETRRATVGELIFHVQGPGASALERKLWGPPVNMNQSEWDNELKMVNARRTLVGLPPLTGVRGESGTIKIKNT